MKIKLIDILELVIWILLALGALVENSWLSLSCSMLGIIVLAISFALEKNEDKKENKGDEEDDNT